MKKLVLKREKILEKISDRKLILGRFNNHLKNVRSALSIINNDIKLMEHLHGILDNKLTLVIQMENTFAEETKMLNFSFSTTEILAMTNETQNSFTSEYLKILLRNSLDEKARKKMNEIEYKADEDFESLFIEVISIYNCDFSSWELFLKLIEERISIAKSDILSTKDFSKLTNIYVFKTIEHFFQ